MHLVIEVLLNIFQNGKILYLLQCNLAPKAITILQACQRMYRWFSLNFMHRKDQLCCATRIASDCSFGRSEQLRNPPEVFYSPFALMETEMAVIFLSIIQKSEVCKTLVNVFLVGEVQLW